LKSAGWFHGWNIVGAVFLAQMVSMGVSTATYGVFVVPVSSELNTSRFVITLGYALLMAGMSVASPLTGQLMLRGSIRFWVIIGAGSLGAGLMLLSGVTSILQFIVVYATLIALGAALAGPLPASTLVVNWFSARRGRALGIATIGASTGGLIVPPVAAALIDSVGWRDTYRLLALASVLVIVPVTWWLVANRPEDRALLPDGAQPRPERTPPAQQLPRSILPTVDIIRAPAFWAVALFMGLGNAVYGGVLVNVIPFAIELGHERTPAAYLITFMTAGMIVGKLVIGAASDRIAPQTLARASLVVAACGVVLLGLASSLPVLILGCALIGLGSGGYYPLMGMLVVQSFPRDSFAKVIGLVLPVLYLVAMLGAPIAGYMFDVGGSYAPAFWIYAACLGAAVLVLALFGRPLPSAGETRAAR